MLTRSQWWIGPALLLVVGACTGGRVSELPPREGTVAPPATSTVVARLGGAAGVQATAGVTETLSVGVAEPTAAVQVTGTERPEVQATAGAADTQTAEELESAEATQTATAVANPLAVAEVEQIPDVVVPAGARLVAFAAATEDSDARADFHITGVEADELRGWFLTHMLESGWEKGPESGETLMFLHRSQLSARHAPEGLKRTATVLLRPAGDGVDITLLVEEPAAE